MRIKIRDNKLSLPSAALQNSNFANYRNKNVLGADREGLEGREQRRGGGVEKQGGSRGEGQGKGGSRSGCIYVCLEGSYLKPKYIYQEIVCSLLAHPLGHALDSVNKLRTIA